VPPRLLISTVLVSIAAAAVVGAATPHAREGGGAASSAGAPEPQIERLDARLDELLPPGTSIEKLVDGLTWLEGPAWNARERELLFSEIPANRVWRWRDGELSVFLEEAGYAGAAPFQGREPGSNGLCFDAEGRLLLCEHGERRVTRVERDGSRTVVADRFEGRRLNSPNDVVVCRNGDVCFTDPPFGLPGAFEDPARELPFSGVYRLRRDGVLALLTKELEGPNGLAFSPDERTLYVSNARPDRPVWMAYPVLDDGSLAAGRVFFDAARWVPGRPGFPDGLKVDARGNLFAAGPGGLYVFAPDGRHLGTVHFGVATSNCRFDDSGRDLFVTASNAVWRVRRPAQELARSP
jgi:gluconolactonase